MKRIQGPGISVLISFAVGAVAVGGVMNYETKTERPATTTVRTVSDTSTPSPTPTPTYDMTPPGVGATSTPTVEGDDGSLGGPVYDENHQSTATPNYVFNTPTAEPTSENADDMDTAPADPTPDKTVAPSPQGGEAKPVDTPPPSPTPSEDEHTTEAPSGDPTAQSG